MEQREFVEKAFEIMIWVARILVWGAIIMAAWFLLGCTHGREYRLYVYDANRQVFVRNLKNGDVLTHEQADGLICQRPEDMKKLYQSKKSEKE